MFLTTRGRPLKMARNTILSSKSPLTSLAITSRVRDVVLLCVFLMRYPVVMIEFLLICGDVAAAFAIKAEVMYTVDVLAVWLLEEYDGRVGDLLVVCAQFP